MAKQLNQENIYSDDIELSDEIVDLFTTVDSLIENDDMSEEALGMYAAVCRLLTVPAEMFLSEAEAILKEIVEESVQNALDNTELMINAFEENNMYYNYAKDDAAFKEDESVPMSLKDINEWYRSVQGVTPNFFNASHAEKYNLMLAFLKEKEREDRDLTDEELFEELEGPEQAD